MVLSYHFYFTSHLFAHCQMVPSNQSLLTIIQITMVNTNSLHLRGAFKKFPDFFLQAFKIVVDS